MVAVYRHHDAVIEVEFSLIPSQRRQGTDIPAPTEVSKIYAGSTYSANVPQVLSAVLRAQPTGPNHFSLDQHFGHRYKR